MPFDGNGGQCEHTRENEDGQNVVEERAEDGVTENVPLTRGRVLDELQRHNDERDEEIGNGHVEYVVIGDGSHVSVAGDGPDDHEVTDQRERDDDDVHDDECSSYKLDLSVILVDEAVRVVAGVAKTGRRRRVMIG